MGPSRAKTNSSVNAGLQPILNTQEDPPTTVQNLASRICKLEKLFADEIKTYTSITAGIPSQYFSCMIKFASLNLAIQMLSSGKFPQWSLYLTPQKRPDHHLTPSLNRPQVLVVLSSGLIPMHTTFSSTSILMVLEPLWASVIQYYSPSSLATTTIFWNGTSQSSSTLEFEINWTQWTPGWGQSDRIKTQPTRGPRCQQKRAATILINNFIPHPNLFSEIEGFLIDGASYIEIKFSDPTVLKPKPHPFFFFHRDPQSFSLPFERGKLSRYTTLKRFLIETWLIH